MLGFYRFQKGEKKKLPRENEIAETSVDEEALPAVEVPDELKPVDSFLMSALQSRNAPNYVANAWIRFLSAVVKWEKEKEKNANAMAEGGNAK